MIELTRLHLTATGLRRAALFPSWVVLLSWIVIVTALICAAAVLTGRPGLPDSSIIVGIVAGSLPSILLVRQTQFQVHGPGRAQAWSAIEDRLRMRGYVLADTRDGVRHYRPRLPRWLRWNEQDVRLMMDEDSVRVTGPWGMLRSLHWRLQTGRAG